MWRVGGVRGGLGLGGSSATLPLAIVESEPLLFFLTHVTGRVHSSIVWSVHGTQRLPSNQAAFMFAPLSLTILKTRSFGSS